MDFADQNGVDCAINSAFRFGPFDHIVGYDEVSLLTASLIRDRFEIPGLNYESAIRFRDKVKMKSLVQADGVQVPKVYEISDLNPNEVPLPLVAKPRMLAGSVGVKMIQSKKELIFLKNSFYGHHFPKKELDPNDIQVEEFIEGQIFHIEGVVQEGQLVHIWPSQYIGNCLEALAGNSIGSVMVTDDEEIESWWEFTARVIKAMRTPNGVFHLEAFLTKKNHRIFLEMGLRPGGKLIVPLLKKTQNIDLQLIHCQAQIGIPLSANPVVNSFGGWLAIPIKTGLDLDCLVSSSKLFFERLNLCISPQNSTEISQHQGENHFKLLVTGRCVKKIENAIRGFLLDINEKEETQ